MYFVYYIILVKPMVPLSILLRVKPIMYNNFIKVTQIYKHFIIGLFVIIDFDSKAILCIYIRITILLVL